MIVVAFGFLVLIAGILAYRSHHEPLWWLMGILGAGWFVYSKMNAATSEQALANLQLDVVLVGSVVFLSTLLRGSRSSPAIPWVIGLFVCMLLLHLSQIAWPGWLYAYYASLNVLFAGQLAVVSYWSVRERREYLCRQKISESESPSSRSNVIALPQMPRKLSASHNAIPG